MVSREEILAEIEERRNEDIPIWYKGMSRESHFAMWFNNFCADLPFGRRRSHPSEILDRKYSGAEYYSSKMRRITCREYHDEIDKVIGEIGLDLGVLEELQRQIDSEEHTDGGFITLYEYALPLYIRLRELGFNHADLAS